MGEIFMKNFRRALIILAIIAALSVGILTTAFASDATDDAAELTIEEKKEAIEAFTPLNQYNLPVMYEKLTWDAGTAELLADGYGFTQLVFPDAGNDIHPEMGEDGDNGYFTIRYYAEEAEWEKAKGSDIHTYPRFDIKGYVPSNNLVIEFDITTFDRLPKSGISFEHGSTTNTASGERRFPSFFSFNSEGVMITYDGKKSEASVIVPDQWTRISILYNNETNLMDIYVNYELMFDDVDTRQAGDNYQISNFRFGTANGSTFGSSDPSHDNGEVSIDNFTVYEGSYVRTPDKFETMNEHEKFIFYSAFMNNEAQGTGDRLFSFNTVEAMVGEYTDNNGEFRPVTDSTMDGEELALLNEKLHAAFNSYIDFKASSYAELHAAYIRLNLDTFKGYMAEADAMGRTLENFEERKAFYAKINAFLEEIGDDIYKGAESDYATTAASFKAFTASIDNDQKILTFIKLVGEYERSLSFSPEAIEKHYNKLLEIDVDENLLGVEGYEPFTEAYAVFEGADELISDRKLAKSAQKIVDCISFISHFTTEEEWIENYKFINKYIVIVRDELRNGKYDPDHPGIDEALDYYNQVNDYFYALLQKEHAGIIRGYLDNYITASGYVEKRGICAYVRSYIASVDIDVDCEDVAPLIIELETYESELDQYATDYEFVLVQNTAIFANKIRLIETTVGYTERYALYLEARELYFAMNVGDESIARELAVYDRLGEEFAYVQKMSTDFLLAVDLLRVATTEDERFSALVNCYRYATDAEEEIDGVAEAMAYYLEQYEAYNSMATQTNDTLDSVSVVSIGSLRANCGVKGIVAVIVKKLGEE